VLKVIDRLCVEQRRTVGVGDVNAGDLVVIVVRAGCEVGGAEVAPVSLVADDNIDAEGFGIEGVLQERHLANGGGARNVRSKKCPCEWRVSP
jgi:hypothetical protein